MRVLVDCLIFGQHVQHRAQAADPQQQATCLTQHPADMVLAHSNTSQQYNGCSRHRGPDLLLGRLLLSVRGEGRPLCSAYIYRVPGALICGVPG